MADPEAARPRIAVLACTIDNGYAAPVFDEIVAMAYAHEAVVLCFVHWLTEFPPRRNLVTDLLGPGSADAVLVVSLGNLVPMESIASYCDRYRPLPLCSLTLPWSEHPAVLVDNEPGMREAVRHLIEAHGRKRIAFVRGPEASVEATLRYRVYREVLAEHGIEIDPRLVSPPGWFDEGSGADHVRRLLDEQPVSFDAVACVNDGAATGALRELAARGIRVPEDVAVVGFDDIDVAPYLEPPLTTVRQPVREQARQAFELLLARARGWPWPVPAALATDLVVRESCGCSRSSAAKQPSDARSLSNAEEVVHAAEQAADAMALARTDNASLARDVARAFAADVAGGRSFTEKLEEILRDAPLVRGNAALLHDAITVLGRQVIERLEDVDGLRQRADAALHEARVFVSGIGERIPAKGAIRFGELCRRLSHLNRALAAAEDAPSLTAALAADLPSLGVGSCYVCIDEPGGVPRELSRLVLAWDARRELALPDEGIVFRRQDVVPAAMFDGDGSQVFVVHRLLPGPETGADEGDSVGHIVLGRNSSPREVGMESREGFMFHALQIQVGAAVRKLLLLERVMDERRRREEAERAHMEKEIRVARRIQEDLLPRALRVPGVELAVNVVRARERGGAYYDVIPRTDGCWIGAGDVSGEGLQTGLLMLMLQSVVGALARVGDDAAPSELARLVHTVLTESNRQRMASGEYAHLALLRYSVDGQLLHCGAAARVLLFRAKTGRTEWAAATAGGSQDAPARDVVHRLGAGDVFVVCRLGLREDGTAPWGDLEPAMERELARVGGAAPDAIGEALAEAAIDSLSPGEHHDLTLIVARHLGAANRQGP
jgi:DNA-binding LacI/PurR family transcriptional regulator